MKKLLLLLGLAIAASASSAFAQAGANGTSTAQFTWTPSTQTVSSNSTFQVTLSITGGIQSLTAGGTGGDVDGYDLWLATAATNSGLFTIDSVSYTRFTFLGNLGPGAGETLNDNTDISSGWVRNADDLGNVDSSKTFANAIANGQTFQVATFTITTGVLSPSTTYHFFTTLGGTPANGGIAVSNSHYTDVTDSTGNIYTVAQSQFDIMTAAVPEPATLSLFGLGGLSALGMTILRHRRA